MADNAKAFLSDNAPWRRTANPVVILLEGIALAVIGLFMLLDPGGARDLTRVLLGVALLAVSIQEILGGFANRGNAFMPYQMLRGGVGATVGTLVAIEPFWSSMPPNAAKTVLGFGLLVVGLIGIAGMLFTKSGGGFQMQVLLNSAIAIALGIMVLFAGDTGTGSSLLGWIVLVGGLLLVGLSVMQLRSAKSSSSVATR